MKAISILGMLALLGIAWALSYHRTKLKPRTIAWGLGLQFLLAVIVLRDDRLSFIGMVILGTLITAYLLEREREALGGSWAISAAIIAGLAVVASVASLLGPFIVGIGAILFLGVALVAGRFQAVARLRPYAGSLFVAFGITWLIAKQVTGKDVFSALSDKVAAFLNLSDYGAMFLFGNLAVREQFFVGENASWPGFGFQFGFVVLPTIVFFGGFMAILYYLGIMQKMIEAMARFMRWTMRTSGAETLSCSANIFVGQTEAPLLIKPFLDGMTRSELLTIMVGGFATIAGGVLAGYIAMGVPAGHLIAASVMSAPAALVIGKIIFPETEHSQTAGDVKMPDIKVGDNAVEAATNGITDGLKLAVNVGAMLIGFIALIAVLDVILNGFDALIDGTLLGGALYNYPETKGLPMSPIASEYAGIFPGSLRTLFGTILSPLAFLMGVPWSEAAKVGNLLGIKLSLNEFVAYGQLGSHIIADELSPRAVIISTYALCGFANFSSIGIQIGGISAVAPARKSDLAKLGLKAMFGGALASWLTATIAGILL
jgi:CNT family concentrative nucleoside transporter